MCVVAATGGVGAGLGFELLGGVVVAGLGLELLGGVVVAGLGLELLGGVVVAGLGLEPLGGVAGAGLEFGPFGGVVVVVVVMAPGSGAPPVASRRCDAPGLGRLGVGGALNSSVIGREALGARRRVARRCGTSDGTEPAPSGATSGKARVLTGNTAWIKW